MQYFDPEFRNKTIDYNPEYVFRIILNLELAIKMGFADRMVELQANPERLQKCFYDFGVYLWHGNPQGHDPKELGRNRFMMQTKAEWSVMFSTDKLGLYKLGLISAKDCDLRKAIWIDRNEQFLELMKWEYSRKQIGHFSDVFSSVAKESGSYADSFCRRLGKILKSPAKDLKESVNENMREGNGKWKKFFLNYWAKNIVFRHGDTNQETSLLPPLYMLTDRAIYDCIRELINHSGPEIYNDFDMDERGLNLIWQRLGLIRPEPPVFKRVEWEQKRTATHATRKLILWDK